MFGSRMVKIDFMTFRLSISEVDTTVRICYFLFSIYSSVTIVHKEENVLPQSGFPVSAPISLDSITPSDHTSQLLDARSGKVYAIDIFYSQKH